MSKVLSKRNFHGFCRGFFQTKYIKYILVKITNAQRSRLTEHGWVGMSEFGFGVLGTTMSTDIWALEINFE